MVERDLSGSVLDGRYRLLSLRGAGGMGQVYEGKHLLLGRRVAIKVLPAHLSEDPRFRARFAREARAASKIAHLNVVQVLDFGESPDGPAYIVMELLEGRDLRDILRKSGRLPWPRARHILLQAVSALKAAHAHDIIHRDIKPGNCVVLDLPHDGLTDVVKLLDFGIAKIMTELESDGLALLKPLTGTGEIVGTASYMAPEQARGEPLDARSDIYSLGIMAYEMLTGRVPFVGANPLDVITRHLHAQPPPLRRAAHDVLPEVEALVLRTLAKDPRDRFESMAELEAALVAIPGPILATVRTRVFSSSGAQSGAVDVEATSGPHTIHRPDPNPEEMATESDHQDITPRLGPLQNARDAPKLEHKEPRIAKANDGRRSKDPFAIEAAPSHEFRLSQAVTKVRLQVASPIAEAADPAAATVVDPLRQRSDPAEDRRRARPPRRNASRQRSSGSNEAIAGRSKRATILRLLGVVLVLGSGGTVASMAMTERKDERPIASSAKDGIPAEVQASIVAARATGGTTSSGPGKAKAADTKPVGPVGPSTPTRADLSNKESVRPTDSTDATEAPGPRSESSVSMPPSPQEAPHETERCAKLRWKAHDRKDRGDYSEVLRLIKERACWGPGKRIEHLKLRVEALLETDRYTECITVGEGSTNSEVQGFVNSCRDLGKQRAGKG